MSTLRNHARCVLAGIALGYVAAFVGAGAVIGIKAGSWLVGPLRLTTERIIVVRLPSRDDGDAP